MNWYQGNIAEAVAMSKTKNAIFVVYVAGSDEMTQKLTNFINEETIKTKLESDDFVAIKIESGTQAYMQFAKIYQVVPVPSIFFIGNSGTPLEVGTGVIDSVVELEQKINNVLVTSGKSGTNAASTSASLIAAEQASSQDAQSSKSNAAVPLVVDAKTTDEIVCEGDVCYRRPKEPTKTEVPVEVKSTEATNGDSAETDSHMEETRKLLEQKRRERIELEKKQEKERELRRRRDGKEMQNVQSWQKEQELKDLKDNIRRDRLEEQAVRERIRAQIAGDRAERAQKFSAKVDSGTTNDPVLSQPNNNNSNEARLQFRLSTGDTKTQNFNCEDELSVVRQFVKSELLPGTGIRDFILATSYPKRELSGEDDKKSLIELELFPSAVILVIGKESNSNPAAIIARSGGIINIFTTLFWAVLSPVFAVLGYVKSFGSRGGGADGGAENAGAQKRANEEQNAQHDAAKRRNLDRFLNSPSTSKDSSSAPAASSSTPSNTLDNESNASKPYRRYVGGSNIHRLTDKQKDSDDENATWNGNSTQQQ